MRIGAIVVAIAAAVAVVAVVIAGGSEGSASDLPEYGVGQMRAGSVAQLAQCSDWVEGTDAQKQVTVDDIQAQLNQAGADGPTPDLSDEDATALLDRMCAHSFASGFRLFKLYARGAAFAPLAVDGLPSDG
jgi:hypothetical protein